MLTDAQLLEFAKNWRCSHPGCDPWVDITEDRFINVARAIERASRRAALEEAEAACENVAKTRNVVEMAIGAKLCVDAIRALADGDKHD